MNLIGSNSTALKKSNTDNSLSEEDKVNTKTTKDPHYVSNPKNFEDLLELLGGFGRFQILVIVLYLILEIPTAFVIFIPIFVGKSPDNWFCGNSSVSLDNVCGCNETISSPSVDSIVSEWNLICENAWISDFITSVQMLGLLVGSIIGSQIADWYGRRNGFLLAVLLMGLGSTVSAVASNPYIYAISRFCTGAGIQCFINVTGAAVMEFMPPKFRSLANYIGPLGEGIMILSVMAYYIRPWRTLYLSTTAPFLAIIFIYPFLPESPRWLLRNNRISEAHTTLNYIAKINRKPKIPLQVLQSIAEKENNGVQNGDDQGHPGYFQFLKDPTLRTKSLFVMGIWFAWSLTYYGISFNIKNLDGHIYSIVFFKGVANALGQRATFLTNDSLGRRMSLFTSMGFGAICMVSLAICYLVMGDNVPAQLVMILCLLSLFGMSGTRSTSKLLTGESFPTNLRAMSFGISGVAITLGGVLSPQMALLGSSWPSVPFFVFAVVSVSGSLITFLMKETKGTNLDSEEPISESNQNTHNKPHETTLAAGF